MQKWQYAYLYSDEKTTYWAVAGILEGKDEPIQVPGNQDPSYLDLLAIKGREGWEVINFQLTGPQKVIFYLKRPIER